MALISIESIADDVQLGLWRMEETVGALLERYPHLQPLGQELDAQLRSEARKKETLATRALLCEMTHDPTVGIGHEPNGKPTLSNRWNISISHTRNHVAIVLSPTRRVGVDIEYMSPRVERIRHKFLRDDETATDTSALLVHWCAKETAYKYFSESRLDFFEMRVSLRNQQLSVENLREKQALNLGFRVCPDYVLTHCHEH